MLAQELSIFCVMRFVQMIPGIVRVQFLLIEVNLGVAVDDNISGGLFSENLRIDIRNMFRQYNGYVDRALPSVAFGIN